MESFLQFTESLATFYIIQYLDLNQNVEFLKVCFLSIAALMK